MPTHVLYLIRHASRFDYSEKPFWKELAAANLVIGTDPPLSAYGELQTINCAKYVVDDIQKEQAALSEAKLSFRSSYYWRVIQVRNWGIGRGRHRRTTRERARNG